MLRLRLAQLRAGASEQLQLRAAVHAKAIRALERDALEDRIEEPFDDEFLSFGLRNAAALQIKERLLLELADGSAVSAADVVGEDVQTGDGVGARVVCCS